MKKATTATAYLLFGTLLWGMTFSFIKDAVGSMNAFNFLFWRYSIASLLLLLIFFKKIHLVNKKLILQGVWLGLLLGGTVIFQTIGLTSTTASTASFITGLSVIMVPLYFCMLHKRWPAINITAAVGLTIIGICLISLNSALDVNRGDFWILLCAICFSAYIIVTGKFSHSGHAFTLTFVQSLTIAVIAGVINLFNKSFTIPVAMNLWVSILFCAIFASILACYLQIRFQRYLTDTKTAIIFALEPVFATLTAVVYLDENLTVKFLIGAGCIFAGMLLSEIKLKERSASVTHFEKEGE
ncbi:MAG TPA: DMT family transporter [Gammaproteobacteria bacterium]|nr:DMT family transporter [Gammaproteobacteria bacterium]